MHLPKSTFGFVIFFLPVTTVNGEAPACSALVCENSTAEDAWGIGLYASPKYGDEGNQMMFGDDTVCGASKISINGRPEQCYGTGDYPTNHFSAEEHCAAAGARLCTSNELQADESHGSGCNYDFEWVWSSTACELTCSSGNTDTGYKVELGYSGAAPVGNVSRCLSPLTENVGVVRCCRDSCKSTRCTGYGACPDPEPTYKAESATDACTYDYDGNVKNGLCECESADTAEACSSLGTSVGSQSDGGSSTCLVVDCGSKGLTFVPTIPIETTKLDLQNNPDLKELKGKNGDVAFKGLDELAWMYIQAVPLDELKPDTFLNFPALATLEISLTELVQIETPAFNLADDALKTLTFADNTKLKSFQLGFFQALSSLENLKFVNNDVYDLVRSQFSSMPNLKTFTARNCDGITGLPDYLFQSSYRLESITLEYNFNVKSISQDTFNGASSVKKLRLIELQGLKSLETYAYEYSSQQRSYSYTYRSLLKGLTGLTDLTIVTEAGGVNQLSINSFAGLSKLERVELKLADLTKVESGVFRGATNLQKVTISGARRLMELPSGLLDGARASVQEIVLAELGISSLSPEFFSGMQRMTSLEISCCMNFAAVLENQFNLPNVEELAIANNPALANLEANAFAGCTKLRMLAVTNNPKLRSLVAGTFDHAFDKDASSVVVNLAGNGFTFVSSRAINFDADGAPDQTIVVMSSSAGTSLEVCCAYEWMKLDRHYFTAGLQCTSTVPTNALIEGREQGQALPAELNGSGESGDAQGVGGTQGMAHGSVMELSDPATEFGCCFTEGWAVGVEYMHRQTVGTELGAVGSYGSLNGRTKEYLADFCANAQWNGATKLTDNVNAYANCTEGWTNAAEGSTVALNCQPQLKDFFKTKFDPNLRTCISGHCPSGSRLESIGKSYLLDCEPWLHSDRSYATTHAVAEQHCVACIVANCKVCDENYRHCDECDAEHSLFVDPVTGVHSCVERTSCPVGFYSTDAHSTLVFDGADGNDDPTDMNLHECVEWTECGDGQKEEVEATSMTDRVCTSKVSVAVVGGTVGGIVLFFILIMVYMRVQHQQKVAGLKEELTKLGKTLVGVRHVQTAFSGRNVKLPTASAARTALSRKVTKEIGASVAVKSWGTVGGVQTRWYWQEGSDRISSHSKHDVLQPGNWVSYSWGICGELDEKYAEWKAGQNNGKIPLDLTNRIASTGTEAKAHGADTGVNFLLDFNLMQQMNVKSSFTRAVNRVEIEAAIAPEEPSFLDSAGASGEGMDRKATARRVAPSDAGGEGDFSIEMEWDESHESDNTIRKADSKNELPADLIGEDDKLLVLRVGQLVQQHNIRDDGWAFGTVLHDGDGDTTTAPQAGIDHHTGWFPIKYTEIATSEHLAKLQAALGEGALSALEAPAGWGSVRDPMVAERFDLTPDSVEFRNISAHFKRTLHSSTEVVQVQRIQNMAMWQSYAMQRQIMATRDQKKAEEAERRWLFHGTSSDTVPKIIQQGFNRGFAGKNAVVYGAGVYFAKNASYSASTTYSPPDSRGVQSMFLVRVLTGFTCPGHNGQPVPDMRDASRNILYDTTTNADQSIFVTYHDSQQYPEYLVQFK